MAVIMISDDVAWFGSASILAFVSKNLLESGRFPDYQDDLEMVIHGWQALDTRKMTAQQIMDVDDIVRNLIDRKKVELATENEREPPFNGLLDRLIELRDMLDKNAAN